MKNKTPFPMFHLSILSLSVAAVVAQAAETSAPADAQEIVVTGYKGSLQSATNAKRESTALVESVFAEDIGKFSDSNIAEAVNRMPGIQIVRDTFGEGVNISVRGLGTSFTKVLLNGANIAVATSGTLDTQNQNREVDLNLFPTELFTRLDIQKTPTADMLEGGVSGIVNLRAARPFDNKDEGFHTSLNAQDVIGELHSTNSPKIAASTSWHDDTFGVLVGVANNNKKLVSEGYETVGWSNWDVSNRMCDANTTLAKNGSSAACSPSGGNNIGLPGRISSATDPNQGYGVVPANAGAGLTAGTIIDGAFLTSHNPGLTVAQISEGLMPRLGRPVFMDGDRNRTTGLVSLEYRPTDSMQYYVDVISNNTKLYVDRTDIDLVGRSGAPIPLNMKLDSSGVVSSVTLANAQFFLEARPYRESSQFYNVNPGAHFEFGENQMLDVQANHGRSEWFREAPTVLINTPLNQGISVDYVNGDIPTFTSKNASGSPLNFNDPNLGWVWKGGRVNIQNEKRTTNTDGAHVDYRFGDNANNIKVGLAYDETERWIHGYDNSGRWENVVCHNGLDAAGNVPATGAGSCLGDAATQPNALVPQSALASYLQPSRSGWITVDYAKFLSNTNYYNLRDSAPEGGGSSTGASTAKLNETTKGAYLEFNATTDVAGHEMKFNVGSRYVSSEQNVAGPVSIPAIGTAAAFRIYVENPVTYSYLLPSFNTTFKAADDVILRFSASRTMTRPNPSAMLPGTGYGDQSAGTATYGNPALSPYLSTNVDFGGEWYTGDEGYVGATLFGKQMTGFTVTNISNVKFNNLLIAQGYPSTIPYSSLSSTQQAAITNAGGPDNFTVSVSQQVNAPGMLYIEGSELTWVQPLDMITKGLGINANYTHIHQRGEGSGAPAQALGVSPSTYNLTTYWENYGVSLRATYVWNDKQISSGPNQNGIALAQIYTDARGQLDLSASYKFDDVYGKPSISLNVSNVTNTPMRSYFQYESATYNYFKTGYYATLGVSAHF